MAIAVGALVVVLAALPAAMAAYPFLYTESILRAEPGLSPSGLRQAHIAVTAATAGVHGVFALAVCWFTAKVWRGRRWARIALTAAAALGLLSSVRSAQDGPAFYLPVIVGDLIFIAIIVLLWAPTSARTYFASQQEP